VRQEALVGISWLALPESIEPLCAIVLTDSSENIRAQALNMIRGFRSDASRAALVKIYDQLQSEAFKLTAIDGLKPWNNRGDTNTLPKLIEIASHESSDAEPTGRLAKAALGVIAQAPVEDAARVLSELFDKAKTYEQKLMCVIHLSGNTCPRQRAKLLDIAQHDTDPQLRAAAVKAITAGLHQGFGNGEDFSKFFPKPAPAPSAPK
jgi:HEAT repeat protein